MDERLKQRLEHANMLFKAHGHKGIQPWALEGTIYRSGCMYCGASVCVDINKDDPPSFLAEINVKDKKGTTYHCLMPHELERIQRIGRL